MPEKGLFYSCSVPQTPAHTTPTPDPHLWGQVLKKRPLIMGLGLFWEIWNNQISEPKKTTPKQNNLFLFCFYDNTVKTNVKKRCFDFCHLKKFYTESFQLQPNLPNNTHGCCKDQPAITFHPLCHGENPGSFLKKHHNHRMNLLWDQLPWTLGLLPHNCFSAYTAVLIFQAFPKI